MPPKPAARESQPSLWQSFKRQSIQEAVIRLMCRDGLRSVTMERVANEVGIAKGTVYLHYRDKQELLDAVKESALQPVIAKMDEIFDGEGTPESKLRDYCLGYLSYFDERRELFRILLYEREVTRVWGSRYQTDRYRHLAERVNEVIVAGIADGTFENLDPTNVAAMFVEANIAMLNQRLTREEPGPVEDDARLIARMFLRGIMRESVGASRPEATREKTITPRAARAPRPAAQRRSNSK